MRNLLVIYWGELTINTRDRIGFHVVEWDYDGDSTFTVGKRGDFSWQQIARGYFDRNTSERPVARKKLTKRTFSNVSPK